MIKQVRLLLVILLLSLVGCTATFWYFERPASLVDALWWWVVTSSTVGYGDVVPATLPGRAAGVFAIIVGITEDLLQAALQHRYMDVGRYLQQVQRG